MPTWTRQLDQLLAGDRRSLLINADCLPTLYAMPPEVAALCACDPPFGVDWRGFESRTREPIANDKHPFIWWLGPIYKSLKPSAALACFHVERLQQEWKVAIEMAGFKNHCQFIWDKGQGGMGDTARAFSPRDERAWIASKGKWRLPNGRPDAILRHPMIPPKRRFHSTEKPVEVMAYLVRYMSKVGDVVIDPTMGSGSTGVAAIQEGRRFIGIELDPDNYAIAKRRVQAAERGEPGPGRQSQALPRRARQADASRLGKEGCVNLYMILVTVMIAAQAGTSLVALLDGKIKSAVVAFLFCVCNAVIFYWKAE